VIPHTGLAYVKNRMDGHEGEEIAHFTAHKKIAENQLQTEREYADLRNEWIEAGKTESCYKETFYISIQTG